MYDVKKQRLCLAQDEYKHLNNALSTLAASRTSCKYLDFYLVTSKTISHLGYLCIISILYLYIVVLYLYYIFLHSVRKKIRIQVSLSSSSTAGLATAGPSKVCAIHHGPMLAAFIDALRRIILSTHLVTGRSTVLLPIIGH